MSSVSSRSTHHKKKKMKNNKSIATNYLGLLEEYSNPGKIREILEKERRQKEIIETLPYLDEVSLAK